MDTAKTVMEGGDTAVQSAAVETTGVEPAAMKPAAMKPAAMKPAAMKPAAMEPATTMPPAAARVGETWLAEDRRAQQRGCNAYRSLCFSGSGFVFA